MKSFVPFKNSVLSFADFYLFADKEIVLVLVISEKNLFRSASFELKASGHFTHFVDLIQCLDFLKRNTIASKAWQTTPGFPTLQLVDRAHKIEKLLCAAGVFPTLLFLGIWLGVSFELEGGLA